MNKICPLMSRPVVNHDDPSVPADIYLHDVECLENKCAFWIEVYTTEGFRHSDCCYALQPLMVNGQFKV